MCFDVIDKNTPHDAVLKHALNIIKILNNHSSSSRQLSEKEKITEVKVIHDMTGIITGIT